MNDNMEAQNEFVSRRLLTNTLMHCWQHYHLFPKASHVQWLTLKLYESHVVQLKDEQTSLLIMAKDGLGTLLVCF